jgi:multidrug resistance efflux pump
MSEALADAATGHLQGPRRRISLFFPIRIVFLLLILAAIGLYIRNRIVAPVSLEGVVNAPLITMRAPIEGHVLSARAAVGGIVANATSLFEIHNSRVDDSRLHDLTARLGAAKERKAQIQQLMTALDELTLDLRTRTHAYAAAQETLLMATIRSQEAIIAGAVSTRVNALIQEDRARRLLQTGAAPQSRLDDALNARLGAEAALDRAKAERDSSLVQLDAARRQIFLESGYGGSSYSQQKADEVRLRQLELRSQLGTIDVEMSGYASQITEEESRLAELRGVAVRAGTDGLISSVYVTEGSDVIRGNPLADVLDCQALYVEASVVTTWFAAPKPGDPVRLTVYGSDAKFHGHIRTLRDPAMALDPARTTPLSERAISHSLTLIIDFDPDDRRRMVAMGCPIGRPITVLD